MKGGICWNFLLVSFTKSIETPNPCGSYNFQSLSLLCYCRCVLHDIVSKVYVYVFLLVVYQSTRVEKQNYHYHKNKPFIGKNTTLLLKRSDRKKLIMNSKCSFNAVTGVKTRVHARRTC